MQRAALAVAATVAAWTIAFGPVVSGAVITVLPVLDLVVAHKVTIPPSDRVVSPNEYFAVIDALIAAHAEQ